MRQPSTKSYSPAFEFNKPMYSGGIVKVIKSDCEKFQSGELLAGLFNIEEYSAVSKEACETLVRKIENPYILDPIHHIGALGMPGLTAYSSLYDIGKPVKGETIFISAASRAVGQIVGQLAKHEGLTVIGSVGSDEKLDFILKELNFDGGFNYKTEKPADALKRLAPQGLDIYYENVGGEQLEASLAAMNEFGRIVCCGMVSGYNTPDPEKYGVKTLAHVVMKRLTMRGFLIGDKNMGPFYAADHAKNVGKWLSEGTCKGAIATRSTVCVRTKLSTKSGSDRKI
ncbi:hypothetical protein HYALB_00006181 [Hymenoscyphus albidus]|uniref:Alcohol dehydrogenase-like C-terminal domain-containing protein n=1 Tax=Hymenoscyphus albidus TaxID=595503 RepID=A0A9N9LL44_9HELO|nr:hypothetical protein HYALB_00006181 [Hymenoscyphus albidus]